MKFKINIILLIAILLVGCAPETEELSDAVETQPSETQPAETLVPQQTTFEDAEPTGLEEGQSAVEIQDFDYSDLEIITLLPQDAIPAIDNAEYYSVEKANEEYSPDELVIGVEFNGDARAYSVSLLSRHEIVNETVGDVKIAVTW